MIFCGSDAYIATKDRRKSRCRHRSHGCRLKQGSASGGIAKRIPPDVNFLRHNTALSIAPYRVKDSAKNNIPFL